MNAFSYTETAVEVEGWKNPRRLRLSAQAVVFEVAISADTTCDRLAYIETVLRNTTLKWSWHRSKAGSQWLLIARPTNADPIALLSEVLGLTLVPQSEKE